MPNAIDNATPPNETWARPSPINARFLISKNTPRNPETNVTSSAATNDL